jgi:hypothetical protein
MIRYIPSVEEVLSCKTKDQLISLIKRDYGLDGIPQRAWKMELSESAYGVIYSHIISLLEKDAFKN